MRSMLSKLSLYIFLSLLLTISAAATQNIIIETNAECLDYNSATILPIYVHDLNNSALDNTTANCTITLDYKNSQISDLVLKWAPHYFYQNFSTAYMGTTNQELYFHVHCYHPITKDYVEGYLTSTVLIGNCNNHLNSKYYDRKLEPTIVWAWMLAIVIIGFFTVYFTSQHHGLSYMFLIVDLLLINVLLWLSGQSCNLNQLTFCVMMWTLYRMSLFITFFMLIVIFIELIKWLISAKDKRSKKKEFEEFGYNYRKDKSN